MGYVVTWYDPTPHKVVSDTEVDRMREGSIYYGKPVSWYMDDRDYAVWLYDFMSKCNRMQVYFTMERS